MKDILLLAVLLSCFAFTAKCDDGQDITVEPQTIPEGFMSVTQGAFWPTLEAWSLNLNSSSGSLNLNSRGGSLDLNSGIDGIQPLIFNVTDGVLNLNSGIEGVQSSIFSVTTALLNLNSGVGAEDITRWMIVRDLTEETDVYGGNWLGSGIWQLKERIQREGYSDGVMDDYNRLKSQIY
jgi:hypothetical protein